MDKYELAFNEWHDKTNWVQDDKRFDVLLPWGKHRADVMKEYIDLLESRIANMAVQLANAESKCRELAAENSGLKGFGEKLSEIRDDLNGTGTGIQGCNEAHIQQVAIEAVIEDFDEIETPATDSFLAEVRAQGVEMAKDIVTREACRSEMINIDISSAFSGLSDDLGNLAAQLRQEAAQ